MSSKVSGSVAPRGPRMTAVRRDSGDSTCSSNKFIHLVVSFRVSVDGANVCGITRTNWSKPHTNSVTPRDTRTTAVRLRSRRLHPLKHEVHPFGVLFPYFREWTRYLRPPLPKKTQRAKTTHPQLSLSKFVGFSHGALV